MRVLRSDIRAALPSLLLISFLSGCSVVDSAGEGVNQAPTVSIPGETGGTPPPGDGSGGGDAADNPDALPAREQDRVTLSGAVIDDFGRVDQVRWEQVFPATRAAEISSLEIDLQDADQIDAWFIAPSVEEPTTVRFRFTAIDNFGTQGSAEVDVTIRSIAVPDRVAVDEDSAANTIDPLSNDNPASSSAVLRILDAGAAGNGTVSLQGTGAGNALNYVPDPDFEGTDTFEYTVVDAEGKVDTTKVTVTVRHAGDAPVITNPGTQGSAAGEPIQPLQIQVTDIDPGETFRFAAANLPPNLVINPQTGVVTGTTIDPGSYAVTVTVTDSDGLKASTSFNWGVFNNPPTALPDTNAITEDAVPDTVSGNLRANDFDGEDANEALVISEVAGSAAPGQVNGVYGTLTWAADGSYSYKLDNSRVETDRLTPADTVNDVFNYLVTDTDGGSVASTLTVVVSGANDAPRAVADSFTVSEDSSGNVLNVLANDDDPDLGDTREVVSVTRPGRGGAASVTAAGVNNSVTYTPAPDFFGTETFQYTMRDAAGETATARVTVTVSKVNDLPVTTDLTFGIDEDETLEAKLSGTDEDNDPLVYSIVSQGTLGTASILNAASGNFRYVPRPGVSGQDRFTYKVNDGTDDSNTSTVTVNIAAVNDAPVAVNDAYTVNEDTSNHALNVLANDSDVEGNPLTVVAVGNPDRGGDAAIEGQGSNNVIRYTPAANVFGQETFTYTVEDSGGGRDTAQVTIQINNVNDPPAASNGSFSTPENTAHNGTLAASDIDGDNLAFAIVGQGSRGTAVVTNTATGAFRYTPGSGQTGADSFTFRVSDGTTVSNTATISVTITDVNVAPVANNSSFTVGEDTTHNGSLSASDADGDSLTYSIVSGAGKGSVSVTNAASGAFRYIPSNNVNGSDSFTFRVSDGAQNSNTATVSITISPDNDPPVAEDLSVGTQENQAVNGSLKGSDIDGDPLSYSIVTNGSRGSATVTNPSTGAFSYTPNAGESGSDSFTYRVSDGTVNSGAATVTVSISAVNEKPVLNASIPNQSATEDTAFSFTFAAGTFSDPDGDSLSYSAAQTSGSSLPAWLGFSAATRTFSGTPDAGDTGSVQVRVTASDPSGESVADTFSITVAAFNDAPTTTGLPDVDVDEGTADSTVNLAASFDDEEDGGTGLSYAVQSNSNPALFSDVDISGSTLTLTYAAGVTGSADLTIRATDSGSPGKSVDSQFTATVSPAGGAAALSLALAPAGQCWSAPGDVALVASLALERDADGARYTLVSNADRGSVTITDPSTGAFEYVAATGARRGADRFDYSVQDPAGGVETRTATVVVQQRIMALGDEITDGLTDAAAGLPATGQRVGYRGALAETLAQAGYEVDFVGSLSSGAAVAGVDPEHEGHAYASAYDLAFGTTASGSGVFAWLAANPADVILLHIGTHGLNPSPADVASVLDEIDRWERSPGGHPVSVLLARIIDRVPAHPDVTLFNDNIAAMATARKSDPLNLAYPDDVLVVDLHSELLYPQDIGDGLHPTQTGYGKMADGWFGALTKGPTAVLEKCP